MEVHLTLVHLYPTILNLYGDRGNILTFQRRCSWRGIALRTVEVGLGDAIPEASCDLLFMGGDQDREQQVVVEDLNHGKADALRRLAEAGVPILAVCGSYQLLQQSYLAGNGEELPGIGLLDARTVHPGYGAPRCVGNIVAEWEHGTIVGFENHGGRTYLGPDCRPLARVRVGFGNNGRDGTEGARVANVFGTYVHGSLLPKNPRFADLLLGLALERRYPGAVLAPLDDTLEDRAHAAAVARSA